jgi:transposase-like protein
MLYYTYSIEKEALQVKYIPPKYDSLSDMAAIDVGRLTENEARTILEGIRWPEGPVCPHCGSSNVTRIEAQSGKVRDGVIQCNACREQFTLMVGTVMQGSHITLRQWVQAFYSMCSHKKGVSALQLQRNLGLGSYHSALHLAHRIRLAMREDPLVTALKGTVEVDETYIGGKPRTRDNKKHKRGRGTRKVPVMVLVERNGKSVSRPVEKVNARTLKNAIKEVVNKNSTIMTDEWTSYWGIGKDFEGGHKVVNHATGEYVNGDASTNTAESYFALLKRGIHGTFHHVSKKHLFRYCDEFSFRWNNRKVTDGERTTQAIKGIEGKRLVYRGM